MGSGSFTASLPSGFSFDFGKLVWSYDRIGVFDCFDVGTTGQREVGRVFTINTSNTFRFLSRKDDGAVGEVSATFPFTWGADDEFFCTLEAPIQGWSSSVRMSDGYEGRQVIFIGGATTQTIATGTLEVPKILTPPVVRDTCACYNPSTGVFKVPSSEFYRISARVAFSLEPNALLRIGYSINSTSSFAKLSAKKNETTATEILFGSIDDVVYLTAGDEIRFGVSHDNSTNTQLPGDSRLQAFSIQRISSPQTIAMGEVVAARYTSSSGQSIPDIIASTVNFNTKEYDTHNAVTTGTNWKFTAPVAGTYHVSSYVMYNSFTISSSATIYLSVDKNNVYYADISRLVIGTHTNTYSNALFGSTSLRLNAGDTINIKTFQSTGSNRTLFSDSKYVWVAIHKIS
jgi:hypothetical protein